MIAKFPPGLICTWLSTSVVAVCSAQDTTIAWTEIQMDALPPGVRLFKGERATPVLRSWYLNVDMNDTTLAVRPYLSSVPGGKEGVVPFVQHVGAYAAVNGRYFDLNNSTSYSAVIYPGEFLAQNIAVLSRGGVLCPATRSLFSITNQRV